MAFMFNSSIVDGGGGDGGGSGESFGGFDDNDTWNNYTSMYINDSITNATTAAQTMTSVATNAPYVRPRYMAILLDAKWWLSFVVTPSVASIGLIGNILSIILISQDGIRKSSNVLLIALAISDLCYLVGSFFHLYIGEYLGYIFPFNETISWLHFYICIIFSLYLINLGLYCAYTIPMLITVERLFAVFFPLKFHLIITPVRTWCAVLVFALLYSAKVIFEYSRYTLDGSHELFYIARGKNYFKSERVVQVLEEITNELTGSVPIVVLSLGCLVIGFKVNQAAKRRAAMTTAGGGGGGGGGGADTDKEKSRSASQSRTTKTLMAVCLTFLVLSGIAYVVSLAQSHTHPVYALVLLYRSITTLVSAINSSSNFFIYVFSNRKFKDRLMALFKGGRAGAGKEALTSTKG